MTEKKEEKRNKFFLYFEKSLLKLSNTLHKIYCCQLSINILLNTYVATECLYTINWISSVSELANCLWIKYETKNQRCFFLNNSKINEFKRVTKSNSYPTMKCPPENVSSINELYYSSRKNWINLILQVIVHRHFCISHALPYSFDCLCSPVFEDIVTILFIFEFIILQVFLTRSYICPENFFCNFHILLLYSLLLWLLY